MTTIKYFKMPTTETGRFYFPYALDKEINTYADENNLDIVAISTYGEEGMYVVFKQRNIN